MLHLALVVLGAWPNLQAHTVDGTVLDAQTHVPVREAAVEILNANGSTLASTETDKNGYYAATVFTTTGGTTAYRMRIAHAGYVGATTSQQTAYLQPRLICTQSETPGADIDCMSYADMGRMLYAMGQPADPVSAALAFSEVASELDADGVTQFAVLGADGHNHSIATPQLRVSSASLNGVDSMPFGIQQFKANVTAAPRLNSTSSGISITTTCPGPNWQQTTYYGGTDNAWCDMWPSEGGCRSCCDQGMALCTSGALTITVACGGFWGWTGVGAVACLLSGAGLTTYCVAQGRSCARGCRERFSCCVDPRGNILQTDRQIQQNRLVSSDWAQNGAFDGRFLYDSCTDTMTIDGYHDGQSVTAKVDITPALPEMPKDANVESYLKLMSGRSYSVEESLKDGRTDTWMVKKGRWTSPMVNGNATVIEVCP